MIITFATSKGGAGKTTTCLCLAGALAARGDSVLIIDLDENKTASEWQRKAAQLGHTENNVFVEAIDPEDFSSHIKSISSREDRPNHILIDVAGAYEQAVLFAMNRSHFVVIPAQPSEPDIKQAMRIISAAEELNDMRHAQPLLYRLVLTVFDPLNSPPQPHYVEQIRKKGIPRLDSVMTRRTPYKEIFATGGTPHSDKTKRESVPKARAEVEGLLAEIESIISLEREEAVA